MAHSPYFIVGVGRSGTTSLAKILDLAENGACAIEPSPNLNQESREIWEGRGLDPSKVVSEIIVPRCNFGDGDYIYGEKQVTLAEFIPFIASQTDAKFVFVQRDGRDVVRSWMDWHNQIFGTIFRECSVVGNVTPAAVINAGCLPIEYDQSDYSRLRPRMGDKWFCQWENFTREQMCSYHWSIVNELHLSNLNKIDSSRWISIDYSNVTAESILEAADFLSLEGLTKPVVEGYLSQRINSINDRDGGQDSFPSWPNWSSKLRTEFWDIAGDTMISLGYGVKEKTRWKPPAFGSVWDETKDLYGWYQWMFEHRLGIHQAFFNFVKEVQTIESIADFGSGIGYGYVDEFANIEYHGYDISEQVVSFANKCSKNSKHKFFCLDYICDEIERKYDIVFSSGTIDNSYDVEMYLASMVKQSKKWVYISCYRGWFPEREEHKYMFNSEQRCFYNDYSPKRLKTSLEKLGCYEINISRLKTNNDFIPYETVISARVN